MSEVAVPWREVAARLEPYIAKRVAAPDVDDVLQDVLLRMHRGLCALRDDDHLAAWMFQIARNAIAERGRDRARHPLADGEVTEPAVDAETDERPAADALAQCLTIFVARLPSPYREAITLVELQGMAIKDAAELAGVSVSGMKSRVQRGRAQLRRMLDECCEIAVDTRGRVTDVVSRGAWRDASCCSSKRT